MHGADRGVEHPFPPDADIRAANKAALALACHFAEELDRRAISSPVAVLACCWLLADLVLRAAPANAIAIERTRRLIDRQIGEAIGELRQAVLTDPANVQ